MMILRVLQIVVWGTLSFRKNLLIIKKALESSLKPKIIHIVILR
jgi:hypothetical protein